MAMRRLIYFSNAAEGVGPRDIEDILAVSRRRNAEAGVTGLLLFMHGVFAQVLEGDAQQVDSVYRRIEADGRHVEPEILSDRTVAQRSFTDWSMAYLETTADDLARTAGFDRLFEEPEFLPVLEDHPEKLEDGIALALQRYAERLAREGARASG
eukprot:g14149.t1